MRELRANARKARKDTATEPLAMLGKGSVPQLDTQSPMRAVAEDDDEIRRYANTCNQQRETTTNTSMNLTPTRFLFQSDWHKLGTIHKS